MASKDFTVCFNWLIVSSFNIIISWTRWKDVDNWDTTTALKRSLPFILYCISTLEVEFFNFSYFVFSFSFSCSVMNWKSNWSKIVWRVIELFLLPRRTIYTILHCICMSEYFLAMSRQLMMKSVDFNTNSRIWPCVLLFVTIMFDILIWIKKKFKSKKETIMYKKKWIELKNITT